MEIRREKRHGSVALILTSVFGILAVIAVWVVQLKTTLTPEAIEQARAQDARDIEEGQDYAKSLQQDLPVNPVPLQNVIDRFKTILQLKTTYQDALDVISEQVLEDIQTEESTTQPQEDVTQESSYAEESQEIE